MGLINLLPIAATCAKWTDSPAASMSALGLSTLAFNEASPLQNLKKGLPMLLFNKERASRIGVLPKDASSEAEIRWFELPAMYAYHVANAWQEGSRIRIFLCVYDDRVRSEPCLCIVAVILPTISAPGLELMLCENCEDSL